MNKEQTTLFNLLNDMTSNEKNGISIRIMNNNENVKFDNYEARSFDPSDVNSLPTDGNTRTQAGFYAHFFAEQWDSQVTQGITGTLLSGNDEMPEGYFQAHVEALYQEYLVTDVITVDYRTVNQENGVSHTAFANFNKNGVFASGFTVYSYLGNNIVIKPANGVVQATTLPNIQRLAYEQVYARIKN